MAKKAGHIRGLFQKLNGNWSICYKEPKSGKYIRQVVGPSKQEAIDLLCKRRAEIREGKHFDVTKKSEEIKFEDFAETFKSRYMNRLEKEKTKLSQLNSLKSLAPYFRECNLSAISKQMVEDYKEKRRNEIGPKRHKLLHPLSINRELSLLRLMFGKAIDWGMANHNPVKGNKGLFEKESKYRRVRFLEKEEIAALLRNSKPRLSVILTVLFNTGMRKGELQNLKWSNVDFRRNMITIEGEIAKNDETRHIPMNSIVRKVFLSLEKHPESPYVFCSENGKPFNFRKSFETASRRAGIKNFRIHDTRHTFASHFIMKGGDLNTLRELLGHKSMDMVLRYSHLSPNYKARAVELLAEDISLWNSHQNVTVMSPRLKMVSDDKMSDTPSALLSIGKSNLPA